MAHSDDGQGWGLPRGVSGTGDSGGVGSAVTDTMQKTTLLRRRVTTGSTPSFRWALASGSSKVLYDRHAVYTGYAGLTGGAELEALPELYPGWVCGSVGELYPPTLSTRELYPLVPTRAELYPVWVPTCSELYPVAGSVTRTVSE